MPIKIGITGGIGSGKSIVTRIFSILGVPVYDADSRAKELMRSDKKLKEDIIDTFGSDSYTGDGEVNRKYLSTLFSDPEKLDKLNRLVHPAVGKDFEAWVNGFSDVPCIVKEAALMFESGSYRLLDKVVVVYAPDSLRIDRVKSRDPFRSIEQIKDIIDRQMPEKEKLLKADYVIRNDEKHMLITQVLDLHAAFIESE